MEKAIMRLVRVSKGLSLFGRNQKWVLRNSNKNHFLPYISRHIRFRFSSPSSLSNKTLKEGKCG
ncbi:hypothetical protein COLO4_11760 [Corchorus olitorius]|uniref:Uncharacterized protein n=1 Tax=Corchorus olitorius TaxID=93759 RepID=A0A1R3K3D1_9ROSI|nr:hypothetical protein COLO4_11760 [Corchorus olitorius]